MSKPIEIREGDCIEVMRAMAPDSVDSVVTDPPYELGFMGKKWDASGIAFRADTWAEVLRVLKPGGHLVAFGGTRTYHRMACAIEDAGFEIRDQLAWIYSSGFPKSHNLDNHFGHAFCDCQQPPETPKHDLPNVRTADISQAERHAEKQEDSLFSCVPEQGLSTGSVKLPDHARSRESGMEGRGNLPSPQGKLRSGEICSLPGAPFADGQKRRLHNGASACGGDVGGPNALPGGSSASPGSQPPEQRAGQLGAVAVQSLAQDGGAWPICERCFKPVIPRGLGTALKPAYEPIVLARKPIIGTIAENVAAHRTGALNIDDCRIAFAGDADEREAKDKNQHGCFDNGARTNQVFGKDDKPRDDYDASGRWPANLLHDGSDEVEAGFAGAARFFYCAKASAADREAGCEGMKVSALAYGNQAQAEVKRGNTEHKGESGMNSVKMRWNIHPTVKPTDLMRWLCRLVTPPQGLILDPFMGSGSTGRGAVLEGFRFVGIEKEPAYLPIARARITEAAGPLFSQ